MRSLKLSQSIFFLCSTFFSIHSGTGQETVVKPEHKKDKIVNAALEIIESARFCALITIDETGHPQARTMQPFPPDENMVVWFGTNPKSRKVKEINNDPRVTLYYGDPSGDGYVVLTGNAILVSDPSEKSKRWMEEWEAFYPDRDDNYLLIKFIPDKMEVVSYKHGLTGDSESWRAPFILIK
jgi:general stress protein 26